MYLIIKKILDKLFAVLFLILLSPVFLLIIIVLKIKRVTPIFFIQERSGKNNTIFKIYKFKTIKDDGKIDRFSNFLRNTGLDEIPQFINILKGEMSFIGPRAWILDYSKNFNKKQMKRLNILPGITGYAQVSRCSDIFEKIDKDCYYVDHISFIFDLKIVFKTFITIFTKNKDKITEEGIKKEIKLLKKKNRK